MGHIDDSYCETGDKAITMATPLLQRMSYRGYIDTLETGSRLVIPLQRQGIDVMVWTAPGEVYCIEVKGEEKHSDNIFIEEIESSLTGKPGWANRLESDMLLWVFLPTRIAHMVEIQALFEYYSSNRHKYEQKRCYKGRGYSVGTVIPWIDLCFFLEANQYQVFNLDKPSNWDNKLSIMGLLPSSMERNNQHIIGRNEYHACSPC